MWKIVSGSRTTSAPGSEQTHARVGWAIPCGAVPINNAIMTNRADAMTADSPITAFAIKQSGGKLEALGDVYDAAPYGIVVPNDQADFAAALQQALTDIKKSGHYDAVLAKYGIEKGAVATFEVNP